MRILPLLFLAPTLVLAQTAFTTDWPTGAQPLTPDLLRQRLIGKKFAAKPTTGPEVRTEYQETYTFINVGDVSDSGTWRTEGSAVCAEWRKLRPSCSEIRLVGEVLYVKRANNGEVIALLPR
jgi:hypothetical protein